MNIERYEEIKSLIATCEDMVKLYEKRAKSFSARLFRSRAHSLECAEFWRGRLKFWKSYLQERFGGASEGDAACP